MDSDAELLARAGAGDRGAFAALVARYRAPVHNYFLRAGLDRATRTALVREVFARVPTALPRFHADGARPWILGIAAHVARVPLRLLAAKLRVAGAGAAEAPGDDLQLAADLAGLPVAEREVVVLACIERLAPTVIAAMLEVAPGRVRALLRRARLALAERLA